MQEILSFITEIYLVLPHYDNISPISYMHYNIYHWQNQPWVVAAGFDY